MVNKKRNRTILRSQNRVAFRQMVARKQEAGDLPHPEYIPFKDRSSLSGKAAETEKE